MVDKGNEFTPGFPETEEVGDYVFKSPFIPSLTDVQEAESFVDGDELRFLRLDNVTRGKTIVQIAMNSAAQDVFDLVPAEGDENIRELEVTDRAKIRITSRREAGKIVHHFAVVWLEEPQK